VKGGEDPFYSFVSPLGNHQTFLFISLSLQILKRDYCAVYIKNNYNRFTMTKTWASGSKREEIQRK
jgi:hypothetical protein